MNLRKMTGFGHSSPAKEGPEAPTSDRCLTLLVEGAALNMPSIDAESYKKFRANINSMAMQVPDRLPDADKLAMIQNLIHEFEYYRAGSENALRERLSGWRGLVEKLLRELLVSMGIVGDSPNAALLVRKIASITTAEEIRAYRVLLDAFLHPSGANSSAAEASQFKAADRTTANDNAAGLRGGGIAVEYLKNIMERGGRGFVVLFSLGCLEMIGERFGLEAVQDSLMAVSAFLTHSLRSDDAIFHWSDSTLLAILQSQATEQILTAAVRRMVDNNRDITIKVGGHNVMLRVPLDFNITPIDRLHSADDLYKLSTARATQW
jgi:GGDEF domain-containing protein